MRFSAILDDKLRRSVAKLAAAHQQPSAEFFASLASDFTRCTAADLEKRWSQLCKEPASFSSPTVNRAIVSSAAHSPAQSSRDQHGRTPTPSPSAVGVHHSSAVGNRGRRPRRDPIEEQLMAAERRGGAITTGPASGSGKQMRAHSSPTPNGRPVHRDAIERALAATDPTLNHHSGQQSGHLNGHVDTDEMSQNSDGSVALLSDEDNDEDDARMLDYLTAASSVKRKQAPTDSNLKSPKRHQDDSEMARKFLGTVARIQADLGCSRDDVLRMAYMCNGDWHLTRCCIEDDPSSYRDVVFSSYDDTILQRHIYHHVFHVPVDRLRPLRSPHDESEASYDSVESMMAVRGEELVQKRLDFLRRMDEALLARLVG